MVDDFVSVRYVGKVGETVVDDRYATTPLVFQLGAFYLPGFDEALTKQCVTSTLRLTGPTGPPDGPLVYDVTIDRCTAPPPPGASALARSAAAHARPARVSARVVCRIVFDAFRDKMTEGGKNAKYFVPEPLTAFGPIDRRWYPNDRPTEPPGQTILEFFELSI
jgi:hypothetical protein